ncbi:helix-turn-helix domain-containing protein [Streptomyces verrucosisporus]|uniref:helix-turn-helix domain-containing protein n=1 Tax=Streptomyces verrucosisporus TaxID=1695161 RepID=UPI0019CFBF06|nr:helix-turn-helix transcriptional regulator [Streptomyces verrucosisporus]MBN3932060.1 helix-turn-helix domain-containing protein [Streptomyces verrucosisporus]
MAAGPTTRRRQLGANLRRLRKQKGLSLEEAGELVGLSKATVSRYETKEGSIKWAFVDALCRAYGASDEERSHLVDLAKNARTEGWWQSYLEAIPSRMNLLLTLENESVREDHFSTVYVPGLLQTRRYAEALHRTDLAALPEEQLQTNLDVRMKRQEILSRPDPMELRVVLDESVVRRAGPPDARREQLAHLIDCARQPNIDLRILPFDEGHLSSAMSTFLILVGADPSLDVVYQESLTVSLYLEKDAEVEQYRRAFADLQQRALEPDASMTMLDKLRREL